MTATLKGLVGAPTALKVEKCVWGAGHAKTGDNDFGRYGVLRLPYVVSALLGNPAIPAGSEQYCPGTIYAEIERKHPSM